MNEAKLDVKINNRLQEIRKKKGLSISELSRHSGVNAQTISRIESNKTVGTIETYAKLAFALRVDLSEIFKKIKTSDPVIEIFNTKDDSNISFYKSAAYQVLGKKLSFKRMLPELITIEPQGQTENTRNKINSDKFVYVLTGDIEAVIDSKHYRLLRNSCIYFDASYPHHFKNKKKAEAKLLSITAPLTLE